MDCEGVIGEKEDVAVVAIDTSLDEVVLSSSDMDGDTGEILLLISAIDVIFCFDTQSKVDVVNGFADEISDVAVH
jgi:hypothetical protein